MTDTWGRFGMGLVSLLLLAWAGQSNQPAPAKQADPEGFSSPEDFFQKRIAPVLQTRCLGCHQPKGTRGGLDLSRRASLLEGDDGGAVVVPGKAVESRLLRLIDGPKAKMPRKGPRLTSAEVADFRRWIDAGLAWPEALTLKAPDGPASPEEWWAFKPLVRPALPPVKDSSWPLTPLDYFILSRLEAKGLKPMPAIDREGFIRRATYDLHGLPPTPEEIDAFVRDTSPDAVENLIDRLLASPRYGERWGRHWLDIVHYADTHGYDKDKRRLWAWLYRDWVIRAFNRDLPYRRFVRYQLAGDVLFPEDPDGIIATGFVAAGPWDFVGHVELREGTVEKEKTRLLDRDDMVASTISTFCSLTAHCARCHDHKFDPISQKDYYQLQAVFAGVERGDRPILTPEILARWNQLTQKIKIIEEQRKSLLKALTASPEYRRQSEQVALLEAQLRPLPGQPPSPSNGYHSGIEHKPNVTKWVQVDLGKNMPLDAIRIIPARPTDFPDSPGFGFPLRFQVAVSEEPDFVKGRVIADHTQADFANPGKEPVTVAASGIKARFIRVTAHKLWKRTNDYVFALAELQAFAGDKNLAQGKGVTALDTIEAGRWSRKNLVDGFSSREKLPDLSGVRGRKRVALEIQLTRARQRLQDLLGGPETDQLKSVSLELDRLNRELAGLKEAAKVYTILPRPPRPIHILHRGNVLNKRRLVSPGALSLLPGLPSTFALKNPKEEGSRRAALADWITDGRNVLTWRSIVNRVWQYHFGRGLVDTPNDFGKNGSLPTHPELLDWLAVEFRDSGQSFKKLHRMILLSAAYRQSSRHDPNNAKIDADNRYLWRMNRQRLDAESIRDSVLAVSGKLDDRMYGPGYELFRFKDDHSPVYDHSALEKIHDPKTYRRTVFRFVVRSVPNPFLESLDCADPNINVPVRNTTMTALQALALLNNPFMVKQSEFLADRLQRERRDLEGQIELAYRLTFGRRPDDPERKMVADYARRHGLANACRLLLNANEFMFID